jgi:hypothetical protein
VHDLDAGVAFKMEEIGGIPLGRVLVFFSAAGGEVPGVEIPQAFQVGGPDGDVVDVCN